MKILYIIYQVCFALPILLVLTILTALVTIIGSLIGGAHIWGYYPGKIWSQLICYILLIPVEVHGREKIHKRTSYVFVPNHQGAFDIFLIYGFLGRNFKWMRRRACAKSRLSARHARAQDISSSTVPAPRRCLPPCGRQNHL